MSIERLVRPFETPVFNPRSLEPQPAIPASTDECKMSIEGGTDGKYNMGQQWYFNGFKNDDKFEEHKDKRVQEEVKVTNPDDEDQYVMVKRMKTGVFENNRTGEKMTLDFASWDKN